MYDLILTNESFDGKSKLKSRCRRIYTKEGKIAGGLTDRKIFDLNGKVLAKAVDKEKRENDLGEKEIVITYRAQSAENSENKKNNENSGDVASENIDCIYTLAGNRVYRDEEYIGLAESKRKTRVIIIPFIFLIGALALLFGIWALMEPWQPREAVIPVITVQDEDGIYWGEGEIAVLDELVYPERSGEYTFKIYNPHDVDLRYSFEIQAGYNGRDLTDEEAEEFPLLFRLKMNNAYMVDDSHIDNELYEKMIKTGLTAEELAFFDFKILAEAETEFTLEWFWPFESGRDELDTRYGVEAGQMYLTLTLTAEEW